MGETYEKLFGICQVTRGRKLDNKVDSVATLGKRNRHMK